MCFLFLFFVFSLQAEVVDKILAIVNQELILLSEVSPGHDLENLIDEEIIAQEIKKLNLGVSEAELDLTIKNIIKQNSLNPETFEIALKTQGMNLSGYRKSLRQQMHKARIIQNKVKHRVISKAGSETKLHLEQATFKTKAQAEEALKKTQVDFKDIGTISKGDWIDRMEKIVFSLKEGETSKPIESPQGFILIRVKKIFETPLEKVDKQGYEEEVETAFKRYVKELRASAYIERK